LGAQLEPLSIIVFIYHEKTFFRPSKWPQKFRNRKTAKNSKLSTNCIEPVGIVGWPPISTWINPPSFGSNGIHSFQFLGERGKRLLNLNLCELLALLEKLLYVVCGRLLRTL
jgi:hypothetical protein